MCCLRLNSIIYEKCVVLAPRGTITTLLLLGGVVPVGLEAIRENSLFGDYVLASGTVDVGALNRTAMFVESCGSPNEVVPFKRPFEVEVVNVTLQGKTSFETLIRRLKGMLVL